MIPAPSQCASLILVARRWVNQQQLELLKWPACRSKSSNKTHCPVTPPLNSAFLATFQSHALAFLCVSQEHVIVHVPLESNESRSLLTLEWSPPQYQRALLTVTSRGQVIQMAVYQVLLALDTSLLPINLYYTITTCKDNIEHLHRFLASLACTHYARTQPNPFMTRTSEITCWSRLTKKRGALQALILHESKAFPEEFWAVNNVNKTKLERENHCTETSHPAIQQGIPPPPPNPPCNAPPLPDCHLP